MARPLHADAAATRERILRSSFELFSTRGPGSVTMRQIAGRAGVSLAMLPHYFGSKAELYRACVDAMAEELRGLRRALAPAFAEASDLHQAIEIAVRKAYEFARSHRRAVQLLMRTVVDTGELDPVHRDQVLLPFLDQGAAILAPLLHKPVEATRLALLSVNYLVIRFALNSVEESAHLTRREGATVEEVDASVADHLVAAARALLLGALPGPASRGAPSSIKRARRRSRCRT